jgi:amino acid transporter
MMSIALTTTIACLLALINLGSSVAFNDVVSLAVNGLYTSYFIGNGLLLYHRLAGHMRPYNSVSDRVPNGTNYDHLTWGPWKMPEPLGTIVNAFGCAYMLIILFFSYWPVAINPTASTMNFSSLMVGATGSSRSSTTSCGHGGSTSARALRLNFD